MSFFAKLFGPRKNAGSAAPVAEVETIPPFPFPLIPIAGKTAFVEWRKLQNEWRSEGCCAVVVGDAQQAGLVAENHAMNAASVEGIRAAAARLEAKRFFEERLAGDEECYGNPELGDWPGVAPKPVSEPSAHLDVLKRTPQKTVYIAKLPTTAAGDVPLLLKYGGWNACPTPEEHAAVLKHWDEQFGLEVYSVVEDVIECVVRNPPKTREACMALAHEQYLYCNDIS